MGTNKEKIKVLKDGPYKVSGNVPLDHLHFVADNNGNSIGYKKTESFPEKEVYCLCRCGHTHDKPYCDGAHETIHFDGTETASHQEYKQMAETIEGKQLDLMDAEELCAGARFCDTKGSTWNLIQRSELERAKDIAVQQCADCPSGRLTPVTKKGEIIEPNLPKEISILEDIAAETHGPLWVKGGITIEDANGNNYPERNRMTLCRCGKSSNKPFCDGNHLR